MSIALYKDILQNFDLLPDTAKIPIAVASVVQGISRDEVLKRYPLVKIGKRRKAVLLGVLRAKPGTVKA